MLKLYLRFVNRNPDLTLYSLLLFNLLIYDEKNYLSFIFTLNRQFYNWYHQYLFLILIIVSLFLPYDLDNGVFFLFIDLLLKNLILCSDYFVQIEFNFTYKIVTFKVKDVLEIINIVNNCFENLLFFKLVIDIKTFHPFWV